MKFLEKKIKQNIVFVAVFLVMIFGPLLFTNMENGAISVDENRYLARRPEAVLSDGRLNEAFAADFEAWLNDNIGFRSLFVKLNAGLRYHVFRTLSSGGVGSSDFYLGPKGEFNYAEKEMLLDYQHKNLYTQEQLDELCAAYQKIRDTLAERGIDYYYMQCRDKHSIYPEQFMSSVNQYGDVSLVDQVLASLKANTTVQVIDTTEVLLRGKEEPDVFGLTDGADYRIACVENDSQDGVNEYVKKSDAAEFGEKTAAETFGRYTDPSHWTEYGAYLAYRELMDTIETHSGAAKGGEAVGAAEREDSQGDKIIEDGVGLEKTMRLPTDSGGRKYRVLAPDDYDVVLEDQGTTLYGGIHEEDVQKSLGIKHPGAVEDDTAMTPLVGTGHRIFTCESAGNDDVLLIIGDSYVENYILDDLAESFGTTIFVWGDYSDRFMEFVELYHPTIVLNENAERCSYRFPMIVSLAENIE